MVDTATRFMEAIWSLLNPELGTLWWIPNDLWKRSKSFVLKEEQEGHAHPGLSISPGKQSVFECVPVLLGTSHPKIDAFPVKLDDSSERLTYFGTLRPLEIETVCFDGIEITPNSEKQKLPKSDCKKLESYIKRKLAEWQQK